MNESGCIINLFEHRPKSVYVEFGTIDRGLTLIHDRTQQPIPREGYHTLGDLTLQEGDYVALVLVGSETLVLARVSIEKKRNK